MPAPPRVLPPMPVGPRLALMKVETIPLHFYRYLYAAVGVNWLWIERLPLDDEALSRKVHRDGIEIFVLYARRRPGRLLRARLRATENAPIWSISA